MFQLRVMYPSNIHKLVTENIYIIELRKIDSDYDHESENDSVFLD